LGCYGFSIANLVYALNGHRGASREGSGVTYPYTIPRFLGLWI
jgi:hypothetical protein